MLEAMEGIFEWGEDGAVFFSGDFKIYRNIAWSDCLNINKKSNIEYNQCDVDQRAWVVVELSVFLIFHPGKGDADPYIMNSSIYIFI